MRGLAQGLEVVAELDQIAIAVLPLVKRGEIFADRLKRSHCNIPFLLYGDEEGSKASVGVVARWASPAKRRLATRPPPPVQPTAERLTNHAPPYQILGIRRLQRHRVPRREFNDLLGSSHTLHYVGSSHTLHCD